MVSTNVGNNIALLRKEKGKTAEQMAEALGVSRQTISKWENGETVPDAYHMVDIATYLDVPISNIYLQIFSDGRKTESGLLDKDLVDYINQLINPKNIEKAIIAYDKNPNRFRVRVGVNVISYRDILLLSMGMAYFMGYSEYDNPVGYQNEKSEQSVIPKLVQYLKDMGFIVFYAGGYFKPPHDIVYCESKCDNCGEAFLIVLRNEKELLNFKTHLRSFFTGIVNVECKRNWKDPSGMKYLLFRREKDEGLDMAEETYRSHVAKINNLSDEEKNKLIDARRKLDELWEEDIKYNNPIQYIKDDQELQDVRRQLGSFDKKTMKEFAEACCDFDDTSIVILDLQNKKFVPLSCDSHEGKSAKL